MEYVFATAVLLLAYFVRGLSGFGSGLVAVPLLALAFPLTWVVPFMLLMDFTASAILGRANRHLVRWQELMPLAPGSVVGVVFGASLLLTLDRQVLLTSLGLLVMLFSLRNLLDLHGGRPISRLWALPASFVGGTVSALFGTGGPPYVIYLSHRLRDKSAFRATTSVLFLLEGGLRGAVFVASGLIQPRVLLGYALALPLMALGLWAGSRVHLGLDNSQMTRVIGGLLLVSSAALLWKAAH
ncbi:sulfite exporter TauE/SafE family protein [Thiobacter aerophilum]|uniref:Probable membrane transporter protein n=1 Tax=Thiobacter aerophilum TaxID=3121275 RepID=A0ABV0EE78_9BURK